MIYIRELNSGDYGNILEISKNIWDGNDYLPYVFDKWIEDNGYFIGAVDSDKEKVVGVGKLSILPDNTGWLEGLRVHIDYRGQKIGKLITEDLINRAKNALKEGEINKIAFSTHINNIESKTMMERKGFKLKQKQLIVEKANKNIPVNFSLDNYKVEEWNPTFDEFVNLKYFKKRNGILPLGFVYQEINDKLFEMLREEESLVKINNYKGIFKYKGEPNFVVMDDSFEGLDVFMNYYLLKYNDKGFDSLYTPVLKEDTELVEKLKNNNYVSWCDWQEDYLYYVYE